MPGAALATRFEGILARMASRFGDGKPLTGTLTRITGTTGPVFNPTPVTTDYAFVGLWGEFEAAERAGGLVEDNEALLVIGSDTLTVKPQAGDTVTLRGSTDTHKVQGIMPTQPGGLALIYRVKVLR